MLQLFANMLGFSNWEDTSRLVVRLRTNPNLPKVLRSREFFLVKHGCELPEGFAGYVIVGSAKDGLGDQVVEVPESMGYLEDGDILVLDPTERTARVLYRKLSGSNSFLLTERCNHYCVMCSQPPRDVNDSYIAKELLRAIPLMSTETREVGLTGGEPTLLGEEFFEIVQMLKTHLPQSALHILSNGRAFSVDSFARKLASIRHPDLMLGIPLYSDHPERHNFVVQSEHAFDETVKGILNLKNCGVRVEIRVVLHSYTIPTLVSLADYLARNLVFCDHVALMGLEFMGFGKSNLKDLWIDPIDYRLELSEAVKILDAAGLPVSIYNLQRCVVPQDLWNFCRRSISDWKNDFLPVCETCDQKELCAGFFSSTLAKPSRGITPLDHVGYPKSHPVAAP